ncbi:hypothetical protein Tco_0115933 [Tanacetum coccineum]
MSSFQCLSLNVHKKYCYPEERNALIRDLIVFGVAGEAKTTSTPTSPTSQAQVTYVSESVLSSKFYTSAGNPVKEILLKLNLPDHRKLKDGGEVKEFQRSFRHSDTERLSRSDEVLKLKNFKKDATLKLFKSTNQEREEAKFPVTKNVNSISLARNEEEENNMTDETSDNTKMPTETETPVREAEAMNKAENGAGNESIKTPENDEAVEASGS